MRFEGRFIDDKGKEVNSWFEAESEEDLKNYLSEKGWKILTAAAVKIKYTGKFKDEKGDVVNWWFEAVSEADLLKHLKEKNWEIIDLRVGETTIFKNGVSGINLFRSINRLSKYVIGLLGCLLVINLIGVWSDALQISLIKKVVDGNAITQAQANMNDLRQACIGWTQVAFRVFAGILFLIWIYRGYENISAFGARGLASHSGWVAASFFIPIVCLYRPYESLREIWKTSDVRINSANPIFWKTAKASPIIACWWILFLASELVGRIIFKSFAKAEDAKALLDLSWANFALDLLYIPSVILLIILIKEIDIRQMQKYEQLKAYSPTI